MPSAQTQQEPAPSPACPPPPAPALPPVRFRGGWLRIARLENEWYDDPGDPEALAASLREPVCRADLLTFIQRLPDIEPRYRYRMEWDNVAAMEITTFDDWWNGRISKSNRKHIRRSAKKGIEIRLFEITPESIAAIKKIYDETPVRQGRRFGHYRKSHEELTRSHSTFPGRREFIGAFHGDELAGFISLIYTGETARSVQLISMRAHSDKWPNNALLARAVQRCEELGIRHLVYGRFDYGKVGTDSLVSFKLENGFSKQQIPRYFIPLTARGRIALALRLHRGLVELVPGWLVRGMLALRRRWHERKSRAGS